MRIGKLKKLRDDREVMLGAVGRPDDGRAFELEHWHEISESRALVDVQVSVGVHMFTRSHRGISVPGLVDNVTIIPTSISS